MGSSIRQLAITAAAIYTGGWASASLTGFTAKAVNFAVSSAVAMGLTKVLVSQPKMAAPLGLQKRTEMIKQPLSTRDIVYGEVKKSGTLLYMESAANNQTLHMILSLASHEIQSIDKVYFNHQYFYNHRDPKNEGLVYIYHNWESGTDNSPIWDDIWTTMNPPEYTFERRDTTHVDASERPSKKEYDHYLHIIEIAKEHHYNDEKIAELSPFLVQDPLFNAMLIKSNESLINLYQLY